MSIDNLGSKNVESSLCLVELEPRKLYWGSFEELYSSDQDTELKANLD